MLSNIDFANDALDGKIFIHASVGYITKNDDIWNTNLKDKTFQIYVHSLPMLRYLVQSYNETKNEAYLSESFFYFKQWKQVNHSSKYVWHEQSVASRLRYFILLSNVVRDNDEILKEELDFEIRKHAEFLLDDNNYRENNHGIMMDRALSNCLPSLSPRYDDLKKEITKIVKLRAKNALNRDFSYKKLHLENSPDYHRLTTIWLSEIENNLNSIGESLGVEYKNQLETSSKIDSIVASPTLRYPIMGDSSDGRFKGEKSYDNFVDYEAGRAIVHNRKYKSQLTFISGYGSKGHKHYDDLSFIFHDGKEYVLNDSGKYNYKKNDPIRRHLISPLAHNSLSKYNELYTLSNLHDEKSKVYLSSFKEFPTYYKLEGWNKSYEKLELNRIIIYFKNNSIVIIDNFNSNEQNTVAVNFNIGLNITVEKKSHSEFNLKGKSEYVLKSHHGTFTSVLLNDSKTTPCKISNRFNKYEENNRILLRQKTRNGSFVTSITPKSHEIKDVNFSNNILTLLLNEEFVEINLYA